MLDRIKKAGVQVFNFFKSEESDLLDMSFPVLDRENIFLDVKGAPGDWMITERKAHTREGFRVHDLLLTESAPEALKEADASAVYEILRARCGETEADRFAKEVLPLEAKAMRSARVVSFPTPAGGLSFP